MSINEAIARCPLQDYPRRDPIVLRGDNRSWDPEIPESDNPNNKILIARDDYHPDRIKQWRDMWIVKVGHIWLYNLALLVTGVRATHGIHTGSWNLNDMRSSMNDPSYNW